MYICTVIVCGYIDLHTHVGVQVDVCQIVQEIA